MKKIEDLISELVSISDDYKKIINVVDDNSIIERMEGIQYQIDFLYDVLDYINGNEHIVEEWKQALREDKARTL